MREEVKEVTKEDIQEEQPKKEEIKKQQVFYDKIKTGKMEEYTESSYYFIKLILKWKKHFMIVSIAAIVVASIFSSEFIIKPKYKSFAIVYPANISPYGSESTAEQLLQLLESSDIRNTIIRKFNLAERYNIDTTAKSGQANLIAAYESNIEVKRTEYESIEIKVLDTKAEVACDMVNAILDALNLKARTLQRDKTKEVLVIVEHQLNFKKHQLDSLNALLIGLRVKYQILDYGVQSKEVIKSYLKALSSGKGSSGFKDIDVMLRNLEEKGGEYYEAIRVYDVTLGLYTGLKVDYENGLKDMNKELTYTNIVTKPFPADKKTYPIRWLIVVASVASADLFLLLILALMDVRKKIIQ